MKSEIVGSVMPMVKIELATGQSVYAQTGAMKWMDEKIKMDTNMQGGVFSSVKRSLSGANFFLSQFSAKDNGATVAFGHSFPGRIIELDIAEKSMVCQKRAFLCATNDVRLDIAFQKRLSAGFFGGEGFIMQKLSGTGKAWVEMDGEFIVKELQKGEKIRMETGSLGMFEDGMKMNIQLVKGFKNIFFGSEGLFLTTIEGPGKVWIQSMPASSLAAEILPFIPEKK